MATVADGDLDREAGAYRLFERLRWGGDPPACPHCGRTGRCTHLAAADGRSRATRTGARTARRVWRCAACRRQFSVLTGTVFAGTRLPLTTWIEALAVLVEATVGDASGEASRAQDAARVELLRRRLGLSAQTARGVAVRWRLVCERTDLPAELVRSAGLRRTQLFQG